MLVLGVGKITYKYFINTFMLGYLPLSVLKLITGFGWRDPQITHHKTDTTSEIGEFTVLTTITDNVITSLQVLPHGGQIICGLTALNTYFNYI